MLLTTQLLATPCGHPITAFCLPHQAASREGGPSLGSLLSLPLPTAAIPACSVVKLMEKTAPVPYHCGSEVAMGHRGSSVGVHWALTSSPLPPFITLLPATLSHPHSQSSTWSPHWDSQTSQPWERTGCGQTQQGPTGREFCLSFSLQHLPLSDSLHLSRCLFILFKNPILLPCLVLF